MAHIDFHIMASTEPRTGVGKSSVPPLAPAVANAVFAASAGACLNLSHRADAAVSQIIWRDYQHSRGS